MEIDDPHHEDSDNVLHSFANADIAKKSTESTQTAMPSLDYVLRPRPMPTTATPVAHLTLQMPPSTQPGIQDSSHHHRLRTGLWTDEALATAMRAVDVAGKIRQVTWRAHYFQILGIT
jgi:hypothetical protein